MRTTTLIKNAFRAMVFPHRVFKEIKDGDRINYKIVIPLMALCGPVHMQLHSAIIYDEHFLTGENALFIPLVSIGSVTIWLVGSVILYLLATIFKKDAKLYSIEIGVFYIWMIMAITPFMDFPHLFGLKTESYFLFGGMFWGLLRFSLIPAFILVIIEMFFLLKHLLKFKGVVAFPLALSAPLAGNIFLDAMGLFPIVKNIFRLLSLHEDLILITAYALSFLTALCLAIPYRRRIIKTEIRANNEKKDSRVLKTGDW